MGKALRIRQYDIGDGCKLLKGLKQDRQFPEGQQPRDIGEADFGAGRDCLKDLHRAIIQDHDSRMKNMAMDLIGDVDSRDGPDRLGKVMIQNNLAGQFLLQGNGFLWG